jgi:uncharacterized pyridoxal phosphate-containing UPF0001 family protein
VADAIQVFDVIQSVDSEKLLRKIDNEIIRQSATKSMQEIYLQVNLSGEEQKYGFDVAQL